jgi:chromosome partitioning protein
MLLVVAGEKGGGGKTTIAVGLAAAFARKHKVVMIDADPQGSAAAWLGNGVPPALEVRRSARATGLGELLQQQAARSDVDAIVIDTPPGLQSAVRIALQAATHVLIPVRPSAVDLRTLGATLDLVRLLAPAAVAQIVVSQAIVGTVLAQDAREAAQAYGAPVCRTIIYHRVAHPEAAAAKESVLQFAPSSPAAEELEHLAQEVLRHGQVHAR